MAALPRKFEPDVRTPPHSVESEQAVLGGLMLDNSAWPAVSDVLVASDFYRHDHQLIYDAISDLLGNREPADAVTVAELLASKDLTHSTGGLVYVAQLVRDTPSAANVGAYAAIIRERSKLRSLIRLGGQLGAKGHDPEGLPAAELLADAQRKLTEIAGGPAARRLQSIRIEARELEWIDPVQIQPRPWLYAKHYMRGMVSATAGIGGAGKSTLLNVEMVSMVIGKDLLRDGKPLPLGPLRVWGHNGEDPYQELQRRLMAVCFRYGVTREDLGGRLRITSGRDMPVLLAQQLHGSTVVKPTEHADQVRAEILKHKVDVFLIDPFVTTHHVNENDNALIDDVMGIMRDLANDTHCAVELAHHLRKLNGDEPTLDAVRGASSIIGAARSARIVAGMSKDEAAKYGIEDDARGYYSWLQNGKANMLAPTHKRRWLRMESVSLGNASPPYEADEIGVIASWTPPECETALNGPEYRMLRHALTQAHPLNQLRENTRAAGWVGLLMAQTLGLNGADKMVKTQMLNLIGRLLANGTLVKEEIRDHAQGRNVAIVRWAKQVDPE